MIDKTFPIAEKLLTATLRHADILLQLLQTERQMLEQTLDATGIARTAANKKTIVVQLEQLGKQLEQVLATEKLSLGRDGFDHYLARARQSGFNTETCQNTWARLTQLTGQCRNLNEQNGASIELLTRHTQRSIQILRGRSQLTTTYGPDGCTRNELFSHTLISV
ncbi:MAG: flagellar protein FlgN [Methylomonas sp.]|nr:flagellar protein FlgN [Methylomonas sp.]PPD19480.1 MAG: flagellar biosynthesis protein FlgN [Methylomonas sp.]PPD25211.1 MAG: flagellar biosynthesis protein FlgN [Methylomonas sp.]PPD34873.1 MAG: flagellar biosynthesis protein FlgN [Methylomonas sp.]PPD38042.1 MAG: flagellar biosynthesis protein FlgN [Methylomonas sp.]